MPPPAPGGAATPAPAASESRGKPLRIVFVGHVDHGKSTLIGRLLHDSGALPEGKVAAVEAMCRRRAMVFEWAFVMDAFQAERDQAVTIDAAHVWFRSPRRDYVIVDAPGHREFVKNMVSGAASCDAGVLVIDADEGIREQSRRHAYLLHLLGVGETIVAVNKMDTIGFDARRYAAVEAGIRDYLGALGTAPRQVVPIAARDGDNVVRPSPRMPWHAGPSLLGALDALAPPGGREDLPFRMPVQDVYHFDERRIVAGRVESGRLRAGDEVLFSPSNKTARITRIEAWNAPAPLAEAAAGRSVGLLLEEPLFIERGETASHRDRPPIETDVFRAWLFWLGREPLRAGARCLLRLATTEAPVEVQSIDRLIDIDDPAAASGGEAAEVARDGIAEVVLRTRAMLALDEYATNPRTGRFVLVQGRDIAGGGVVDMRGYPDQRPLIARKSANISVTEHAVSRDDRARRNGHRGGVVWLTGLSGAGKSTLAVAAELHLFRKGYQVRVLDGDNVRGGLNANLGFSPNDRAENIRRVGEVAALFADSGLIVLTAFISPYRSDRERAREATGRGDGAPGFHEVHVRAPLEVCEARDPKGLYRRARDGKIADFTGVSAPYEPPVRPELVIDTGDRSIKRSLRALTDYIERTFALAAAAPPDAD